MIRVFKVRGFAKFCAKEGIADAALVEAVARAEAGLIDADLGGGVIKQRVARTGQGKSGGFRTIIFYRTEDRAIFAYGFAKKDRENLNIVEQGEFKRSARIVLAYSDADIGESIRLRGWMEVGSDE